MEYEMPPVENARTFTTKHMLQADAVTGLNRINGVWARVAGDHLEYGLSPMLSYQPSPDQPLGDIAPGTFIPNPAGDELLYEAIWWLYAADTPNA